MNTFKFQTYKGLRIQHADKKFYVHYDHITVGYDSLEAAKKDVDENGDKSAYEECPHDERDHGVCLDCGDEEDPGAAIDRAMDSIEDR